MSNRSGRRSSYSDQETISGRVAVRHFSATTRPAVARGDAGHLWKLPVQKSAPSSAGASIRAGAWAPSTIDRHVQGLAELDQRRDREHHRRRRADLVHDQDGGRRPGRRRSVATTVSSSASSGTSTTTTSAWFARANRSAAYRTAPYAWLVSTIRLPARIGRVASAAVTPALAFGTRAKPAGSVCRYGGQLEPARGQPVRDRAEPEHRVGLGLGAQCGHNLLRPARRQRRTSRGSGAGRRGRGSTGRGGVR